MFVKIVHKHYILCPDSLDLYFYFQIECMFKQSSNAIFIDTASLCYWTLHQHCYLPLETKCAIFLITNLVFILTGKPVCMHSIKINNDVWIDYVSSVSISGKSTSVFLQKSNRLHVSSYPYYISLQKKKKKLIFRCLWDLSLLFTSLF